MDTHITPQILLSPTPEQDEDQRSRAFPILTQPETICWQEPYQLLLERALEKPPTDQYQIVWHLGQAPLPDGPTVVEGGKTDWVLSNLSEHPIWENSERFPVPRKELAKLKKLHRSGAKFDSLVVADEIPKDALVPGDSVPLDLVMPPPPPRAVSVARWLGVFSQAVWLGTLLPFAIAAAPIGPAALLVYHDPILFGVQMPTGVRARLGEIADWFYICRWSW